MQPETRYFKQTRGEDGSFHFILLDPPAVGTTINDPTVYAEYELPTDIHDGYTLVQERGGYHLIPIQDVDNPTPTEQLSSETNTQNAQIARTFLDNLHKFDFKKKRRYFNALDTQTVTQSKLLSSLYRLTITSNPMQFFGIQRGDSYETARQHLNTQMGFLDDLLSLHASRLREEASGYQRFGYPSGPNEDQIYQAATVAMHKTQQMYEDYIKDPEAFQNLVENASNPQVLSWYGIRRRPNASLYDFDTDKNAHWFMSKDLQYHGEFGGRDYMLGLVDNLYQPPIVPNTTTEEDDDEEDDGLTRGDRSVELQTQNDRDNNIQYQSVPREGTRENPYVVDAPQRQRPRSSQGGGGGN